MSTAKEIVVKRRIISILIVHHLFPSVSGTTFVTTGLDVSEIDLFDNQSDGLIKAETVQSMPSLPHLVKEELLAYHNHVRRIEQSSNMIELHWDDYLALDILEKVQKCDYELARTSYQNVDVVTPLDPDLNLTEVFKSWHAQKKNFDFKSGSCRGQCDEYVNMVRSDTIQVGCAIAYCRELRGYKTPFERAGLFACRYHSLSFRFRPKIPFKKGKVCSKCPDKFEVCHFGLCAGQSSSYPDWDPADFGEIEQMMANTGFKEGLPAALLALIMTVYLAADDAG